MLVEVVLNPITAGASAERGGNKASECAAPSREARRALPVEGVLNPNNFLLVNPRLCRGNPGV